MPPAASNYVKYLLTLKLDELLAMTMLLLELSPSNEKFLCCKFLD